MTAGRLRIVDAVWTPRVNMLVIECPCDADGGLCRGRFPHPADRWSVQCPTCGARANLATLRDDYQRRGGA